MKLSPLINQSKLINYVFKYLINRGMNNVPISSRLHAKICEVYALLLFINTRQNTAGFSAFITKH
jgi:hypothetical protein